MRRVADESVHLIVTSPPYWQLKDYGHPGQIGWNQTWEQYIASLNRVWDECERVLHPGCRMCINIGDQFARAAYYGRYKVISIRTEIIRHCESALGLDYMGAIIWQKVTSSNPTGGATTVMGSYPYPRNGIVSIDYKFILLFKKPGRPPQVSTEVKEAARLSYERWFEYFAGHWNFPGERSEHIAAFPEELPPRPEDFGPQRCLSAGVIETACELAHSDDWCELDRRERVRRLVEAMVQRRGRNRRLVRQGVRNAPHRSKELRMLIEKVYKSDRLSWIC